MSRWAPDSIGLGPHQSKKLCKWLQSHLFRIDPVTFVCFLGSKFNWRTKSFIISHHFENKYFYETLLYSHLLIHAEIYIYILDTYRRNDNRRSNKRRMIKTQEGRRKKTSLEKYSPLTLLQGIESVVQGLHVGGCWRPDINFIFWPPRLMTVTLCLSCSLDVHLVPYHKP